MKKGITRKGITHKVKSRSGSFTSINYNTRKSSVSKRISSDNNNYSKVISFIVRNEEDEIGRMITASKNLSQD